MITLAQAKVSMVDPVDQNVIDEFQRSSYLMDHIPFANDVAPATGGQTLVYGYTKLKTPSTAGFRAINGTYTAGEAIKERKNAYLKIMGGNFKLDRVIIGTAGSVDELNFQLNQKIKATTNLFHWTVINGDSDVHENEFDGLNKLCAGASTEVLATTDISTSSNLDSNYNAFLDEVNEWIAKFAEKPTMLLMNSKMLTKMKNIARRAGYYSRTEDAFGRTVDNWDNIPMVDMGQYFNGETNEEVVGFDYTYTKTTDTEVQSGTTYYTLAGGTFTAVASPKKADLGKYYVAGNTKNTTAIYGVVASMDGFHGVSLQGNHVVESHLPDLNAPGTIKEGDVEFVGCVALKNTLKAGALKGIKVR